MNRIGKKWTLIGAAALIVLMIGQQPYAFAVKQEKTLEMTMTVQASTTAAFVSELDIASKEMTRAVSRAKVEHAVDASFLPDIDIAISEANQITHYRLESSGSLWREEAAERLVLPRQAADRLLRLADTLRSQHYGKQLSWQEAQQRIPNKSIFSITDLESGLTFQVQRRAGKDHADVQPMTKADSRIMKQIYNDKWSWKRKAVLIHAGNEWIAASMNGMPHGGDGIPENGFSGHFCIHFYLSSTHKSDQPDPAHQMMVHKAAGRLQPYFESAAPLVLARSFIDIMYHQDAALLHAISTGMPKEKQKYFAEEMSTLVSIREEKQKNNKTIISSSPPELDGQLSAEIKLPVSVHKQNKPRQHIVYSFAFNRSSVQSPWRISDISY
ncbi:hypothetical protein [Paenibacillus sp. sgz302251]|uniref:hypothetical protein n=1 Tax=Paenibacillus sp. sgz302251 TaxID=3414493 RepID=UPI003C79ACF9